LQHGLSFVFCPNCKHWIISWFHYWSLFLLTDTSISRFFNWVTIFLICIMCSRIPLTLMNLFDENFMIKMLVNTLYKVMNWSLIAFSKSWTFSCWLTKPCIPISIIVFYKHHTEAIRLLSLLVKTQWSVGINNYKWFVFFNCMIHVRLPCIKKNSFFSCFIVIIL